MGTTLKQEQVQTLTLKQRLEQTPSIDVSVENYGPFLRITGDDNPIHTDEDYALKTPFKGLVVPGLYLPFIMMGHLPNDMISIELFFRKAIRPGSDIRFLKENAGEGKMNAEWYDLGSQKKEAPTPSIEARITTGSKFMDPKYVLHESLQGVDVYSGKVKEKDIKAMVGMAGMIADNDEALKMHAAAYASAGLMLFAKEGVTGAYKRQQFIFHSHLRKDEQFKVLAREIKRVERKGKAIVDFEYNIVGHDERPVITGEARVAEIRHGNT